MFAIVVTIQIKPEYVQAFMPLMLTNAAASLAQESGCLRFDICTNPNAVEEVFLYELYTDAAMFDVHLASEHFKTFDDAVAPMIADKTVKTYQLVNA